MTLFFPSLARSEARSTASKNSFEFSFVVVLLSVGINFDVSGYFPSINGSKNNKFLALNNI